ncbi:MAG: NTP transferase domain-containing protein [Verrucomicrobiota bacterium]|nr:NTP transferase domain-containing protein [Verrucomicrobiota bacterium]
MSQPTLLVLAAGIGSRYGGLKQMDPVGPSGETLMDYSIYDALRSGFGKLVFVIRRDIEEPFRKSIAARFEKRASVTCVFQELGNLPPGFSVPPGREKPWGTGQAILSAADAIAEPFGVINADDFYGARSFQILADHLRSGSPDFAMVAYVLRQTLSEHGSVARGVCMTNREGFLKGVTEIVGIEKDGDGAKYAGIGGTIYRLIGDAPVSLNLWGFTPALFGHLRTQFDQFLREHGQDERIEFYIPAAVNELIRAGRVRVKVLRTPDSWFGVTYREDRPRVMEGIRRLITRGDYPEKLWP